MRPNHTPDLVANYIKASRKGGYVRKARIPWRAIIVTLLAAVAVGLLTNWELH